jgi:predicted HAD superfamily Cof-like phosphohydrolase
MSDYSDVGEFHMKFGLPRHGDGVKPGMPDADAMRFRVSRLVEEIDELRVAVAADDFPAAADALVDLVYIALGTAHFCRLPWPELFAEVQRANMSKRRAASPNESRHGTSLDVVKPEGWRPPNIIGILMAHGWDGPRLPFTEENET